ncbi:hypothetical protein Pla110_41280 [Polystyrenella longa]|uniref:DUF1501 domain-containing protein n=1 Tax=Polystyrenella longa TaxID=2528007 RepID=A0A518CT17_9PLAN|nr:DUF1501 domain-containing protein [Polystyrenella longa]QDU82373.1 hypothetical protein Pla110_41280 [Polystyrenella longa]
MTIHEQVRIGRTGVNRRRFLHTVSAASLVAGTLSFRDIFSLQAEDLQKRNRSMILLWLGGGPSQMEMFDPKPGTENGGETKAIQTSVAGIDIAHRWEQTAKVMDDIAIIRSMTNKEGNHRRASYHLHTGYVPSGSVKHPSLAANVAYRLADPEVTIPSVVSVGNTFGAGYLGVDYEPFVVSEPGTLPTNTIPTVDSQRFNKRLGLLGQIDSQYADRGAASLVKSHQQLYKKTRNMISSPELQAFDFADEPAEVKQSYGNGKFGQGCLLARRLIEAGSTFVEVSLGGWDTHQDIFERTDKLIGQVDPAFATLIADLKSRGLLETTTVVLMGEFGRTPKINARGGRDHFPRVFNVAMAGGGIRGGQVIGSSTEDGQQVAERPVTVSDLFCSLCHSLELDPASETMSPLGRPMKIVEEGETVDELFA